MTYKSLHDCVVDLKKNRLLIEVSDEVDPHLEIAALHRRLSEAAGPAVLFKNVKGTQFPVVINLFGTKDRAHFLFRHTLKRVQSFVRLKIDPPSVLKNPASLLRLPFDALSMLPRSKKSGPILAHTTTISQLPQIVSWPRDGGAFITLPQVYTESALKPGWRSSNLGMYRIQLSGNDYTPNFEIGLHYQIHRGIGVHHSEALQKGIPFKVNIFVGGPPAMTLAAVMPLPEGLPELAFAGLLGGRRIGLIGQKGALPLWADADFCIQGTVMPGVQKPEGPFGDHLGYYSLKHDYPVLQVEAVHHRANAIWPHTTVGRPPQEDSVFGDLIHEIAGDMIPQVLPGVKAVHAVDAAGVHPLLLALGSERYTPHSGTPRPQELLTQANAILGQGQLSLAKYLMIANSADDPELNINDVQAFMGHMLERLDFRRDLHFQTETTLDTLDYSSGHINRGSKLVLACVGPKIRNLPVHPPRDLRLPDGFKNPKVCLPGVLAITAPKASGVHAEYHAMVENFCRTYKPGELEFPLIVLVDDSEFTAKTLDNFIWVVFTRSNPADDVEGIGSFMHQKHWGAEGSLVIDARLKPHHAPPLEVSSDLIQKVDSWAAPGRPFHGLY